MASSEQGPQRPATRTDDRIGRELVRQALLLFEQIAACLQLEPPLRVEIIAQVCRSLRDLLQQDSAFVDRWLEQRSEGSSDAQGEIVELFVEQAIRFLVQRNQFLIVSPEERRELGAGHEQFASEVCDTLHASSSSAELGPSLQRVVTAHLDRLTSFVNGLVRSNVSPTFVASEVVSSEYSPELQLEILDAPVERLLEPILDLGCGLRCSLVRYLRQRGLQAWGLDRALPASPFLIAADWLDHPLEPGYWGTIISHLGLSNHFLHHHLRPGGLAERYARRYMEVLRALRPGGRFLYAPGLPFIERLLPGRDYLVETRAISPLAGKPIAAALRAAYGTDVLYACQVTRRSRRSEEG